MTIAVSTITVSTLTGPDFVAALDDLARLRIIVFRDWPYLYDGNMDYERKYMAKFAATAGAVIVAARDGARIVGCATAVPLLGHEPEFAEPLLRAGYDPKCVFYFGESVLLHEYRGLGIGHQFFDQRETAARLAPHVTHATFCSVVRPAHHPARPTSYVPLDSFWAKRGYRKIPNFSTSYDWTDVGDIEKTSKPMQFWMRQL